MSRGCTFVDNASRGKINKPQNGQLSTKAVVDNDVNETTRSLLLTCDEKMQLCC